jgi:hypothetical protein
VAAKMNELLAIVLNQTRASNNGMQRMALRAAADADR